MLDSQPQPGLVVPDGLDPLLTLALGLRAGYPVKPPLPVGREIATLTNRLPAEHVLHAPSMARSQTSEHMYHSCGEQ